MSILEKVTDWPVRANEARYSAARLAKSVGASPRQLRRYFSNVLGVPLRQFLRKERLTQIEALLRTNATLHEIADKVAWKSIWQLCREFKKEFGVSPVRYHNRMRDAARMAGKSKSSSALSNSAMLPSAFPFPNSLASPEQITLE
jgi:AraC-like DNA-binding protein